MDINAWLQYLFTAFADDMDKGRMPLPQCGWRYWFTLMPAGSNKQQLNKFALEIVEAGSQEILQLKEGDILNRIRIHPNLLRFADDGTLFVAFPGIERWEPEDEANMGQVSKI